MLEPITLEQFIEYYGKCTIREQRYGTVEAIAYIIRNAKDQELKDTMLEVVNEYLDIYEVKGVTVISTDKKMPDILAEKLIDKKNRLRREKLDEEERRYFKDKEVKQIIANDIIERIK